MRTPAHLIALAICSLGTLVSPAANGRYLPLESAWALAPDGARNLNQPNAVARPRTTTIASTTRPTPPGLRPRPLELLADALQRKRPIQLGGSPHKARQLILEIEEGSVYQTKAALRGYMAEALYIDRNSDTKYVSKPNATQHDAYRMVPGRQTPSGTQIKYHKSGDSATYARDMVKDWRADRFAVPNDHVAALQDHWRARAKQFEAAGQPDQAKQAKRHLGRVARIGATSAEIERGVAEAARTVARERASAYLPLAACGGLILGPTAWDWARGEIGANQALYRVARGAIVVGAGFGADVLLKRFKDGSLRGTLRGNGIIGSAVGLAEAVWLIHEHGGQAAFHRPEFYESLGGSVGAITIGTTTFIVVTQAAAPTGPWAPVIGGGASLVTGTLAHLAGRSTAHMFIAIFNPEMLRQQERQQLATARAQIDAMSPTTHGTGMNDSSQGQ